MKRGGLVGLGNIAVRGHVPAYASESLRDRMGIVAVMDVVAQNKEKAREHLPGATFYTDIATMIERERLDFVDICTPPHTHAGYIRTCAERGLHLLCEKPLVQNASVLADVEDSITRGDVVFVPCHQYKYSPLWKSIHDVIRSGAIGDITLAQFNVYRLHADTGTAAWNPQWRTSRSQSGGGILVDTGAHYFYLIQQYFGAPARVSAMVRSLKHKDYGVEDTALVTLEYPNLLVQINLTWAAAQRANSAYLAGKGGSLSYDGSRLLKTTADRVEELPMPDVSDKRQYVAWYVALLEDFDRRISEKNTQKDLLVEALNVMKLLDLSYASSERGTTLEFA